MDKLLSPDTFEFLAQYFLAGWVFLSVRSWWVRGERPKPNDVLFEAITLSLLNQLLWLGVLPLLAAFGEPLARTPLLVIEVLLLPMILGLFIGIVADQNWLPDGLRRLFMPSLKPVSEAYAFAFDQLSGPTYIIISFEDGRTVFGYFGEVSMADSNPDGGGIYLETLYSVQDDKPWVSEDRGVWVSLAGVRSIEFIAEDGL